MQIRIRKEEPADYPQIEEIIRDAFRGDPHSDHTEQHLVSRLRSSNTYIPKLALVATDKEKLVGHILFTRLFVQNKIHKIPGLALAPVSVSPRYQKMGIGSSLIEEGHRIAEKMGEKFIALIGHEHYYPRFGYKEARLFGIQFPFDVPSQNAMVHFLQSDAAPEINGKLLYSPEFFEN